MTGSRRSVSCYGKLPFHREYLRVGLESPAAAAVVAWIERAHEAISSRRHGEPGPGVVAFALAPPAGKAVVSGVVRQSSDGQRRHPIAFFVEDAVARVEERWHLLPLALADTWAGLTELLVRPFHGVGELSDALESFPGEVALDAAADDYATWLAEAAPDGPWAALTGVHGDDARNVAANFLAVAEAQRDARAHAEGIAIAVSLAADDEIVRRRRASLWLELLGSAAGSAPLPTIAFRGTSDASESLCALYRPADGADLAAMLGDLGSAPIDDLREIWDGLPAATERLERLIASTPAPLSELRARVQAAL
jgi:hypothetical protein